MGRARSRQKGLFDLVLSTWTVFPVVAAWSLAIFCWAVLKDQTRLALFLLVVGVLLGLGMTATLWILRSSGVDPLLGKLRQQFAESLDSVRRVEPRAGSREAELNGTAAQLERV